MFHSGFVFTTVPYLKLKQSWGRYDKELVLENGGTEWNLNIPAEPFLVYILGKYAECAIGRFSVLFWDLSLITALDIEGNRVPDHIQTEQGRVCIVMKDSMELLTQFLDASEISYSYEYKKFFSNPDNVEDIMEYVSFTNEEWKKAKEKKEKYLKEFAHKLSITGLQIPFLRSVIIYISDCLANKASFADYEHAIRYNCIAAAGLKDLDELKVSEREGFFENLLTGIHYAGEIGQKGYAYRGREEIKRYTFLLTGELVKELAERNFVIDADSIVKRSLRDNMVYFVSCSCITAKEKEEYKKIDGLLVKKCYASLGVLADSLERVFEGFVLSSFTDKDREEWQQIIELQEEHKKDRVSVWGKLDVWKCSIQYRIVYEQNAFYRVKQKVLNLEYRIDLTNNKEVWRDISKSKEFLVYSGEITQGESVDKEKKVQNVLTYLADWAQRSISGSMVAGKDLEVQCFWHDKVPERYLEENIVRVKGCPCIKHGKEDNKHIFTIDPPEKEVNQNQYWINNADNETIKSINILLGRNGSGKTSTMMMLRYDGVETNAKEALTKFFIVYKRGENYFYSTNLEDEEYDLRGDVLEKGKQDISKYRGQKNKVIYYSNVLCPYEERMELMASNTIDISSQYIRDIEIGGLSRNEMIHTNGINDRDRGFRLKHKQDYNQDVLRQLYFLYDTDNNRKESWMPDYVKRFVFMRCDLDAIEAENKIDKYLANNELKKNLTGFWEYREWVVYYHDKNELKKIIDICEKIIKDEEILYFEVCLPQMSSGEKARITLFSRLHAWVSKMTFSDFRQNNVLLLDELEAYMHPEWQRCLIYDLISFFEWEHSIEHPVKVQLFISSNSPFLISDVDVDEITVMSKDIEVAEKTFAQNIHVILKDSFFCQNGSMGKYAKQKVDGVYKILAERLKNKDISVFERNVQEAKECNNIIEKIGEPLIYKDLREMYEEAFGKEEKNIESQKLLREMSNEELMRQMRAAQEELERRRK